MSKLKEDELVLAHANAPVSDGVDRNKKTWQTLATKIPPQEENGDDEFPSLNSAYPLRKSGLSVQEPPEQKKKPIQSGYQLVDQVLIPSGPSKPVSDQKTVKTPTPQPSQVSDPTLPTAEEEGLPGEDDYEVIDPDAPGAFTK